MSVLKPKSVAQGSRVISRQAKAHKHRPTVGRGKYVKAPLLRDKVASPRWQANAVINNPGHVVAGTGLAGGGLVLGSRRKEVAKRDQKRDAAAGAAVGGGAAHFARTGADYGTKALAERQFKPLTTKGNYGPYKEGPHKPALNKYKRTVHGDVRTKAKMFDANFPRNIPSSRARRAGVLLGKKPVIAGIVGGGAAVGAGLSSRKVSKADKKNHGLSGSAIAGAGAVTASTGLVAGGIPKAKAKGNNVFLQTGGKHAEPPSGVRRLRRGATVVGNKAPIGTGGILGFRHSIHEGGTEYFRGQVKEDRAKNGKSAAESFWRGRTAGKIAPEEKVMSHMRRARGAAGVALVGGTAATAYGVHRARSVSKAQTHNDRYNGALLGAGGGGLAVSHGATKVLGSQKRKWAATASRQTDEAGKLVPAIAGRKNPRVTGKQMHRQLTKRPGVPFPKSMYPAVSDHDIKANPKLLSGVHPKVAEQAGHLRGAAAQGRHFSEVYGSTAKVVGRVRGPSALVAAVGAGGLATSRMKDKNVRKSAFGVDH